MNFSKNLQIQNMTWQRKNMSISMFFFYKRRRIQGLGSDMLKAIGSSRPEVFLQIGVPAKFPKSLKNTCEGVHLSVKL